MKTAIVAGALANKVHNGGAAWTRLSWALGLKRVGFDVWLLEQIEPDKLVDEVGAPSAFADSANLAFFRRVTERFGFRDRAALTLGEGDRVHGLAPAELRDLTADAELVINITGNLKLESMLSGSACKIYLDLDPGYTQFWHAAGLLDPGFERHDLYFTVGETIGAPGCPLPTGGIDWRPIRQPVLLEHWPVSVAGDAARFTTVASWRDPYGTVTHEGRSYGLKVHEFRRFIELPRLIEQRCEIALDIDPVEGADRKLLTEHGWRLADPGAVAGDPHEFRRYVQGSGAEFSVAKGVYVETRCGWFSDRSVRYLASGKPVLVQNTGFRYPTGAGLLCFDSLADAVDGARLIAAEYPAHCEAARTLAETWFDSDRVLGELLDAAGVTP